VDDLLDGCTDGCSDGCLGWWPWSGSGGDTSDRYQTGYASGVIAGSVLDGVAEESEETPTRRRVENRARTTPHGRITFRVVVRAGYKQWLDDMFVDFGRKQKIAKINRYGLSLRLRPRWTTCWVIAFGTPEQEQALRRRLQELKNECPERIKHYK